MKSRMPTLEALVHRCRERGLPVTIQRRAILEALIGGLDHPSADEIFVAVQARHAGVNRATIYRALDILAGADVISRVPSSSGRARFDARQGAHHHLHCERCDLIIDWETPGPLRIPRPSPADAGFEIRETTLLGRGVCPTCASGEARQPRRPLDRGRS